MKVAMFVAAMVITGLTGSTPAGADGAIAVGSTSNVARDGIALGTAINYKTPDEARDAAVKRCHAFKPAPKAAALCQLVGTFKGECYAIAFDPKAGTPGAGWAIAATKELAEQRALANCKATAGPARQDFCVIDESKCDGT